MVEKSSFNDKRLNLWAPLVKGAGAGFIAVLSDDSIDRDDEVVGKEALRKIADDDSFTVALLDHENKVMGQVAEWIDKRIENIDGHETLIATPRFFKSNPNAVIVENMLKEGAKMGISIGAIVHKKEDREVMGKTRTVFTDLELIEASFVAVPSNRHAHAMAVAKSYNKTKEDKKMSEENIETLNKTISELEENKKEAGSKLESLNKELSELKKATEKAATESAEALEKSNSEAKEKIEGLEKALEEAKKMPVNKMGGEPDEGAANDDAGKPAEEEKADEEAVDKAMKSGQFPVLHA